ncbi:MAG: TylF/MycF/NovP-related O-methyltransferase [Candidatus Omnitrophota bacterium]
MTSTRYGYRNLKKAFIQNSRHSKWNKAVRREIIDRFEAIDKNIINGTAPTEVLFMAEALLNIKATGSIVECGCWAGSSTAKLSILAKLLGKKMFVFDSFEGLPNISFQDGTDLHTRQRTKFFIPWRSGEMSAGLGQVKRNLKKYGEISVVTFHKGWFKDTLLKKNLPDKIAFAFTDVDIVSSVKKCITAIWPRISERGVYFSHDVAFIKSLQALLNEKLWKDVLKEFPPILFGAGFGMSDSSNHLGFFVKGKSVHPEYIKSLTVYK